MLPNACGSMQFACALTGMAFSTLAQGWLSEIINYPSAQTTAMGGVNNVGLAAGSADSCDFSVPQFHSLPFR